MSEYCCDEFKSATEGSDLYITEFEGNFYIEMWEKDPYRDKKIYQRKMNYCLFCGEKL